MGGSPGDKLFNAQCPTSRHVGLAPPTSHETAGNAPCRELVLLTAIVGASAIYGSEITGQTNPGPPNAIAGLRAGPQRTRKDSGHVLGGSRKGQDGDVRRPR